MNSSSAGRKREIILNKNNSPGDTAPRKQRPFGMAVVAALSAAALLQAGCGSPAPETRLENASNALSSSTAELATVNERIDIAESQLADLKDARRRLRDRVRTLEERLAARATDVALFRAVQNALLEETGLQESALAAQVDDAVITLTGVVKTAQQEQRAIAIANGVAGVDSVVSRVVINDPETAGSSQ